MGDAWDDIVAKSGLAPPKPVYGAQKPAVAPSTFTANLSNPRVAGFVRETLESARTNILNGAVTSLGRNNQLNNEAANLYSGLVMNNLMTEADARDWLRSAARDSGVESEDGPKQTEDTIDSGFKAGQFKYGRRDLSHLDDSPNVQEVDHLPGHPKTNGHHGPGARIVKLRSFADELVTIPTWIWHYNGYGRIYSGTLCVFGGPPGTGKSTAARWFAAQFTRGTLDGEWFGKPVNVAYVAVEEDHSSMVTPSLIAACADMSRVFRPEIVMDGSERILRAKSDEAALLEQLQENNCRVLIVDPIMSTLGGEIEINKNNEVRDHLQPFVNIAKAIDGVVIGIAHYRKSGAASGVTALTGSSAFGEVARSVFGFMKDDRSDDGTRVMSQSKNSAGREDLALRYDLELVDVLAHDGRSAEMARFRLLGDSDVRVEDLMTEPASGSPTKVGDASMWLEDYLLQNGATPSKTVKADAAKSTEFGDKILLRAAHRLKVVITNRSVDGKPRVTFWELPVEVDSTDRERYW